MATFGALPNLNQQPSLTPITAIAATSVDFGTYINETFTAATQVIGYQFNRSNATVAMTDTLPDPAANMGYVAKLPNGWNITIRNIDASATVTITPTLPATIDGTTDLVLAAGDTINIVTDGTNYFSSVSP